MEEAPFSWSNIGNTSPQPTRLMQLLETIPVLLRDNKLELQSNMANLRMEMVSAIADIHKTIGNLKVEVHTMNNNFLLDSRKVLASDYDDRSVTTFLTLDELDIIPKERPIEEEDDVPIIAEEITIVSGGLTAPVPEKPIEKVSFDGMTDEDIVVDIVSRIEAYLQETPVLMNFSFKKKSIIPRDYIMPKSVKELLKASVKLDDSPIRLHKLDKMRGMYYLGDVEDPAVLYEETFN
jgi:hypothetical protein